MEALLEWGRSVGVEIPAGITFKFTEEKGFTAVCNDINGINNPKIVIPRDAIITNQVAEKVFGQKDNTLLKFLLARLKFDSNNPVIIEDCNITEKFSQYINILPKIVNSPLIWTPNEQSLLSGTNLGNSLKDKFKSIFKQWYDTMKSNKTLEKYIADVQEDINLYLSSDNTPMETIYDKIVTHTTNLTPKYWYSFAAFLWSHLIFTSRAFPEYVINKGNCEPYSVILLPIIDLLNHSYNSKVEWSTNDDSSFIFTSLLESPNRQGDEILNNYGAKGNEELLSGYGFVLEDNICDSVLLKIKLPLPVVNQIIHDDSMDIKLPTINDYTTFAFDDSSKQRELENGKENKLEYYQGGIVYLLKKADDDDDAAAEVHSTLKLMLDLFTYLAKNELETFHDIRPRFEGIQHLREAIQQKLDLINADTTSNITSDKYPVEPYRKYCAHIYRGSQINILKDSIKSLKRLEKQMMKEYSKQLLTMSRLLKHDPSFIEKELPQMFPQEHDIEFQCTFDLFVVWIFCKIQNDSFSAKDQTILVKYNEYWTKNTDLEQLMTPEVQAFIECYFGAVDAETTIQIHRAFQYVTDNTFTRRSTSEETILVC